MNLQIACVFNGNTEYIEMFGNEAMTLDLSFAEIQDITKKNSAFSKDFKVPGSKQNNYLFNYFFDINQVPLDFTPNKKFEANVMLPLQGDFSYKIHSSISLGVAPLSSKEGFVSAIA